MPRAPRDPRRILLVSERADFYGGGQRSLLDLAVALRSTPYEPVAVLPSDGPLAAALTAESIPVRTMSLPRVRGAAGASVVQTVWALAALARREGVFLLHSDSPRAALYSGLASRLVRRSHLWHLRASQPSSGFSDRMLLSISDRVVAVSRAAANRSAAMRASERVRVVHTGLRDEPCLGRDAARTALGLPATGLLLAVVGRVEPDKGGDDALTALPLVRATHPGARLCFLGAMDDRTAYLSGLRRIAAGDRFRDAVRFLGDIPDAGRMLRAFDLILHPSRHEALPRVLIEALRAGVPALAADVGGVGEVIDHGTTGWLVPARDPAALGAAAAALLSNPDRLRRMGEAGPPTVLARFSLASMGQALGEVYTEMLTPHSHREPRLRAVP